MKNDETCQSCKGRKNKANVAPFDRNTDLQIWIRSVLA